MPDKENRKEGRPELSPEDVKLLESPWLKKLRELGEAIKSGWRRPKKS